MPIEELGKSLLANVRERNDEVYEREQRDMERRESEQRRRQRQLMGAQLGMKALVGLGNSYIQGKNQAFANSEENMQKSIMFRNQYKNATGVVDTLEAARKHAGGEQAYFLAEATSEATEIIEKELENRRTAAKNFTGPPSAGAPELTTKFSDGSVNRSIKSLAQEIAADKFEAYKNAEDAATALISRAGTARGSAFEDNLLALRPQTMTGALGKKISGWFSKGPTHLEIQAAKASGLVKSAQDFKVLGDLAKKVGDGEVAADILTAAKNSSFDPQTVSYSEFIEFPVFSQDHAGTVTEKKIKAQQIYYTSYSGGKVASGIWVDMHGNKIPEDSQAPNPQEDLLSRVAKIDEKQIQNMKGAYMQQIMGNSDAQDAFKIYFRQMGGNAKDTKNFDRLFFGTVKTTEHTLRNYGMAPNVARAMAIQMSVNDISGMTDSGGYFGFESSNSSLSALNNKDAFNPLLGLMSAWDLKTSKDPAVSGIAGPQIEQILQALVQDSGRNSMKHLSQPARLRLLGERDKDNGLIHQTKYAGLLQMQLTDGTTLGDQLGIVKTQVNGTKAGDAAAQVAVAKKDKKVAELKGIVTPQKLQDYADAGGVMNWERMNTVALTAAQTNNPEMIKVLRNKFGYAPITRADVKAASAASAVSAKNMSAQDRVDLRTLVNDDTIPLDAITDLYGDQIWKIRKAQKASEARKQANMDALKGFGKSIWQGGKDAWKEAVLLQNMSPAERILYQKRKQKV